MRIKLLTILLFFTLVPIRAQQSLTFLEVDTSSYNAYLAGDWNKIIVIGNNALEEGIDYYYLRMRMGYAFFMKTRYRLAIPHYKKALEYSSNNATALEYLYYCYHYSGRLQDAQKLIKNFPENLKASLEKSDSNKISEISLFTSFGTGASDEVKNEIITHTTSIADGTQKVPNSFSNYSFNLKHNIGHSVFIDHSVNFLQKDQYAILIENSFAGLTESQSLKQYKYQLGIEISPIAGFTIKPSFSIIHYRIPILPDYSAGYGQSKRAYNYYTDTDYTLGLKTSTRFSIFDIGLAGVYSELNRTQQLTGATSLTLYPLNNLNLYYSASAYIHSQKNNSTSILQIFHTQMVGFKVFNHLWLELNTMIGEYSNLHEPFTGLTYNSLELYGNYLGAKLIVPFYKTEISLIISYSYHQSESIFVPTADPLKTFNNIEYNYHTITGGILWKL